MNKEEDFWKLLLETFLVFRKLLDFQLSFMHKTIIRWGKSIGESVVSYIWGTMLLDSRELMCLWKDTYLEKKSFCWVVRFSEVSLRELRSELR